VGRLLRLDELQRLQAAVAVAADDEVIVDRDAHGLGDRDDLVGHADIGGRGCRVAGRMVVDHDQYRSVTLNHTSVSLIMKGLRSWLVLAMLGSGRAGKGWRLRAHPSRSANFRGRSETAVRLTAHEKRVRCRAACGRG